MRLALVSWLILVILAPPALAGPQPVLPTLAWPDGALDLYCVVDGSLDLGCCEANTAFVPGGFGLLEFAVMVRLSGATADGISGAEFYLDGLEGLPGNWTCSVIPEPGVLYVGNICDLSDLNEDGVFEERRGHLVFEGVSGPLPEDGCQVGDSFGYVRLATVRLTDVAAPTVDLPVMWVNVVAGDPPSNPVLACPVVTLCNSPVFTAVCVGGGAFLINNALRAPTNPSPPDGATEVNPLGLELSWEAEGFMSCILGVEIVNVYFGSGPDPPLVSTHHSGTTYAPGSLVTGETYFWRVSRSFGSTTVSSPVWSFTTGEPIAVEVLTWAQVKGLFR